MDTRHADKVRDFGVLHAEVIARKERDCNRLEEENAELKRILRGQQKYITAVPKRIEPNVEPKTPKEIGLNKTTIFILFVLSIAVTVVATQEIVSRSMLSACSITR